MLKRLARLIPRGRFAERLAWLTGGTLIGQLLILAATPLITRLFSPEDFGLFGVIAAINGIFGLIMAGRYEFAIPLVSKDNEATGLVAVSFIVTLLLTLVSYVLIWVFGDTLAQATGLPTLTSLLWFVPLILLVTGLGQPLEYLSIRRETLRLNGASRILQFGGQAGGQVGFGVAGTGALGLIWGYGLGYVGRLMLFLGALSHADRVSIRKTRLQNVRELMWTHRYYPTYSTGSSLLKSSTQFLPTILFAAIYGPAMAGAFNLAQRILIMPIRLLSNSASQAFLAEAAQRQPAGVLRLFMRMVPRFLVVGIVGMAPLVVAGPELFAFVFGEPWREAGVYTQALVAAQLGRFVAMPVSQTFNIFGRQDLDFKTSVLNGVALVASFLLIVWLHLSTIQAVLLYSLTAAVSQLVTVVLAWRVTQQAVKADVPVRSEDKGG